MSLWTCGGNPCQFYLRNVTKRVTVPQTEPDMIRSSVLTFEEIQHGDVRTRVAVFQNAPFI